MRHRNPSVTIALAVASAVVVAVSAAGAETSSITGRVSFDGTPPAPERVNVSADPRCERLHPGLRIATVAVTDGGLANTVVWLKSGAAGPPPAPAEPVVLDQRSCEFVPHVVAVRSGQSIAIRNSDDALHNIHARPRINAEFNIGQPRRGMESVRTFNRAEIMIPIGCDVHPWMRTYVSVFDHPFFAVTRPDGTFELTGVPPGEYEIEAVHETLGSQTQSVIVKPGAEARADFAFRR